MAEPNMEPVEKWLLVWEHLDVAVSSGTNDRLALNHLIEAVYQLVRILEPPSVREARLKDDAP